MRKSKWLLAAAALAVTLLAAGGLVWLRWRSPHLPPPPTPERLAALRAQRDQLQARFREIVVAHGEKSVADAPRAGVMIGIPTSFTASILEQVVTGLFGETTLTLRNLKIHREGSVKAKLLFRKKKIGQFILDVDVHQVRGLLKPGRPTLGFGRNKIDLALPVSLAEGQGTADLRFQWDSKGLAANLVCGDVDVTRAVSGDVVPENYKVSGHFAIATAGQAVLLHPRFPDLAVRVFVDPTEQAWGVVDEVVKARRKGCEIALNKVDVKQKLGDILGRGFDVKVPQKIFKPIRLPAGVNQSLEIQGIQLALQVKMTGVMVARDRIWYGADLRVSSKRPRR
jgi:hypothetical protein